MEALPATLLACGSGVEDQHFVHHHETFEKGSALAQEELFIEVPHHFQVFSFVIV